MPVSEAQKRATAKFEKERYDKVLVRFPKGTKEKILNAGAESVNGYIIKCVLDSLENTQKATQRAERVSNDKTIEQLKSVESVADKQSNSISLEETQKILNAKREECKNVQYLEPKKEERKPVNNIDDALTEQLHAIKERRETAKNNELDECPF